MNNKFKILIPLIGLIFMTGCVQKTKITMKVPGELNVKGIHKIAIMNFSSVKSDGELGVYSASNNLLKLAKDEVANTFYNEPYYSFSNLEIEKILAEKSNAKPDTVFDGILYGKLWWKITPEYQNIIPSKETLETYKLVRYVSGRSKKGKTYYSTAHVTTKMKDKAYNMHYRVKHASLMMSLNLYKVLEDGSISKVTEVFEVAKGKFQIKNGDYGHLVSLIGEEEKLDKIAMLKKKEDKGFFGKMLGGNAKTGKKVTGDLELTSNISTIPSDYTIGQMVIAKISKKLQKMIAPTKEEFELEIEKGDSKVEKMFDYSAFNSIRTYIVETKLAQNKDEFYDGFYEVDYLENTKGLLSYLDEEEFNKANEKKKEKAKYTPIEKEKLDGMAFDYLKDNVADIYNYALATEAVGGYEESLEIYRFLFNEIDNKNQLYANGIGRSLLALDMGDKVSASSKNKRAAKKAANLK